jgi:hypothetical protein
MERDGREELSCAALADQAARLAGGLRDAGLARISHQGVEKGRPLWHNACENNELCANKRTTL